MYTWAPVTTQREVMDLLVLSVLLGENWQQSIDYTPDSKTITIVGSELAGR